MMIDRRGMLTAGAVLLACPARAAAPRRFPPGFLWGAATAGYQVEGNDVNADVWVLENTKPTVFAEPSADADNSFALWPQDLDLVRGMGLNSYRFSLEWARIQPEEAFFSVAMLDHYRAIIEGCRARGLTPVVTFNHYTTPRWFARAGGWLNPRAPDLFARFCGRAARHLAQHIGYATTLNEPNILRLLDYVLPPQFIAVQRAMIKAASAANGVPHFIAGNAADPEDLDGMTRNLLAGHAAGRAAIKSVRPDLPVGVSLAMFDDQQAGPGSLRDAMRQKLYQPWLQAVRGDDFIGVQNYQRAVWDAHGMLPAPPGVPVNDRGAEVYAPSLANAVRYAHQATGLPVIVTEHGVATDDDRIRAALIPAALAELHRAIQDGVPVRGYIHWSLLDNFEWISGFKSKLGLYAVDRTSFVRTPKPSAAVLASIARANAL